MVRQYKGAFSGEHGDGLVRTEWVAWQFGPRLAAAFAEVKRLFDPIGLMNPGKIVAGTPMDDVRLFRTPPGWGMMCSGSPNHVKDGIQPLVGLIETDWLPFPFTMNWIFTRPGRITFEKGEPFCFINLIEHKKVEQFQPIIRTLESNPVMKGQFEAWNRARTDFNQRLAGGDPDAAKEAWQRYYFKGEVPEDLGTAPATHSNKRRLKSPRVG